MKAALKQLPTKRKLRLDAQSYRLPMQVTEVFIHRNQDSHYVCPRCTIPLEREFTAYCDRCGQCLCWKHYQKARPIFSWREGR